jgi:16S rRNA (guanine527-N7)-methyltransferase
MLREFIRSAESLGVGLTEKSAEQLLRYLDLLRQWNKVHNLCADASYQTMLSYHILDSISVAGGGDIKNKKILDIGSGAGLPGIPLSITEPSCAVTLVESKAKKIAFINHVVNDLKLPNVIAANVRIEVLEPKNKFNIVISRAFAELGVFVKAAIPFCLPDGVIIAMKADCSGLKIADNVYPGCTVVDVKTINVPGVAAKRSLVIIKKNT